MSAVAFALSVLFVAGIIVCAGIGYCLNMRKRQREKERVTPFSDIVTHMHTMTNQDIENMRSY